MKVYQEETIPVCRPDQSESGSAGSADRTGRDVWLLGDGGVLGYTLKLQGHQKTRYAMRICTRSECTALP